jgi:hypothetical protein
MKNWTGVIFHNGAYDTLKGADVKLLALSEFRGRHIWLDGWLVCELVKTYYQTNKLTF